MVDPNYIRETEMALEHKHFISFYFYFKHFQSLTVNRPWLIPATTISPNTFEAWVSISYVDHVLLCTGRERPLSPGSSHLLIDQSQPLKVLQWCFRLLHPHTWLKERKMKGLVLSLSLALSVSLSPSLSLPRSLALSFSMFLLCVECLSPSTLI